MDDGAVMVQVRVALTAFRVSGGRSTAELLDRETEHGGLAPQPRAAVPASNGSRRLGRFALLVIASRLEAKMNLTAASDRDLGQQRRLFMVRARDNPGVDLTDLFRQEVTIGGRAWRVLDVSFRDGLGTSSSPSEVGLTVTAI